MLELTKIVKDYETPVTTVHALRGVSLNFRPQEFVAILGPSGCGKTTLLNIIGGLDRYSSGDMRIGETSTKDFSEEMWDAYRNATIGFVFQSYNLIPHLSILENVELALSLAGEDKEKRIKQAQEALEIVDMGNQSAKKPSQLSGGQMQRAAIARALVNNPQIVLADEPTGALDSELSEQVMGILSSIAEKTLVIMVTHNDDLAKRYCNRIIKIKDGSVASDSNPLELTVQPEQEEAVAAVENGEGEEETDKVKRLSNRLRKRRIEAKMRLDAKSAELLHLLNIRKKAEDTPFKGTSMKMKTALGLSYKNLTTKKKRTFLTSFAGSIGIIGLSLVLALANGFNSYIDGLQSSILAAVPIGVYEYNVDYTVMTDVFANFDANAKLGDFPEGDELVISPAGSSAGLVGEMMSKVMDSVSKNNISEEYVNYLKEMDDSYYDAINYCYAVRMNILSKKTDDDGSLFVSDVSPEPVTTDALAIATNVLGDNGQEPQNWHQLVGDKEFMLKYYDVLAGKYPENANEIVLTVSADNAVQASSLYEFGLDPYVRGDDGKVVIAENGGKLLRTDMTFSDIIGSEFRLIFNDDYYTENDGIFAFPKEDTLETLYNSPKAETLKVVGVIRVKPDSPVNVVGANLCYTPALAEKVLENSHRSKIAVAQQKLIDEGKTTTVFGENMPKDNYLTGSSILFFVTNKLNRTAFLKSIGVQCTPSYINIYPTNFDGKTELTAYLDAWNDKAQEEDAVRYFDVTEMFIYNMRTIVDLMTYVLLFVSAISLVVSSIMIGVITGNSVIERTREIGILRSIGARKRDIMRVFNAETGIIGFVSGALGIGVAYALTPLGSLALKSLSGIPSLMVLNPLHALGLLCLSITLTLISGLIPARNASRKNVVEALRIE